MKYKMVSRGLKERKLVPISYNINDFIGEDVESDYYESIYQYDEQHKKLWDTTNSVAGVTGLITKKLVFDFDSSKDMEYARKDAVELVSRLVHAGLKTDELLISMSGSKGFHIEINTTEEFTRKQFENTVKNLAEGLATFDPKIVDENRIFRVALTKHPKTKAYKIPLTIEQLASMPIDAIQSMAKNTDDATWDKFCSMTEDASKMEVNLPPSIKSFKNLSEKEKKLVDQNLSLDDKPNMQNKPKHMSSARFALQQGFFEAGERNEAYMILAATYKALGYDKEIAYNMLKATNRLQTNRTGQESFSTDELWLNVVSPVYGPNWRGATYSERENKLLIKTIQKYNLETSKEDSTLIQLSDMSSMFSNFAINIDSNTIKLGLPLIDKKLRITTSMLVCLLAAPSAGKSTVSFGVLNHLSKQNLKSFFFSLDMGAPLVYQRLIQRLTGDDGDLIFENYRKQTPRIKEYETKLKEEYKNVKFCFQSGLTVDLIREALLKEKETTGEVPKLVLVDYLECVDSQFSDPTQSKGYVAKRLKDIANEFNTCVLLLVQPAKISGDPSNELTSYTQIKGSSVIQEAASVILTLSRPGFDTKDPKNDKYVTFTVVKNRMGSLGSFDLGWDGLTGRITELMVDELEDLKILRNNKAKEKKAEGDLF